MKRLNTFLLLVFALSTTGIYAQTGTLHLYSDVPGMRFYLNDKLIGEYQDKTVVLENFPVGWHTIIAKKPSMPSQQKQIKIEEGGDYYLNFVFNFGQPVKKDKEYEEDRKPDFAIDYHAASKQPVLKGGEKAIIDYIKENNLYPQKAKDEGKAGVVILTFIVGADGIPYNMYIVQEEPSGYGFGKAAMEVMRNMVFEPAEMNGEAAAVNMEQVVSFKVK